MKRREDYNRRESLGLSYVWLVTAASGHEGPHAASDDGSTDGAVAQAGRAVAAHHQVTTGDEDDGHQLVHAHLAGPLLLQLPQQLLWTGVPHCGGRTD